MFHLQIQVFEFISERISDHHQRVRRVVSKVAEERLLSILFNECQGMISEIINHVTFAAHFLPVVVERWTEVMPPIPGGEAVELIKTPIVRMIGRLRAVVPLAKGIRCVAC